ncbi:hypothetical protein CDD83_6181 [Cordyceps sp. RAO-2017]|nr:hypothetical protein CDD83_6181 [Cordyceps sp. RAO-2017]
MPASTASPTATSRPVAALDPTTTEHDFRFPRRPEPEPPHGARDDVHSVCPDSLLGDALFPSLQTDSADGLDQLQRDDPLATQVWRFFKSTKQQLPNQQRLENLTWRMMALSMRRHRHRDADGLADASRPAVPNAPSGIAQLRKTSEIHAAAADPMNLDDFIFAHDRPATPAGLMSPPPLPSKPADAAPAPSEPAAAAIPIKLRRESASHFVPQRASTSAA